VETHIVGRTLNGLTNAGALVGGLLLVAMMVQINLDVICRFFFDAPLPLTLEIVSHYYIVAVVFLPLAMVERDNAHISVELLSQHLPPRPRELLIAAVCVVSALYYAMFTYVTWVDGLDRFATREYIMGSYVLAIWQSRFLLPIGCGLLTLYLVWKSIRLFKGAPHLLESPDDTAMVD